MRAHDSVAIRSSSALALYLGFGLVGFCTALPGAILPVLRESWRLTDRSAGALFLLLFLGSCIGSLSTQGRPDILTACSTGVLALACMALSLSHGQIALFFCVVYGFGFGMMLTSITRLQLKRRPATRVQEVNRLNLIWGIGAFLCPTLANALLSASSIRTLFVTVALILASLSAWMFFVEVDPVEHEDPDLNPPVRSSARLPLIAATYTFLAVGTEATMGAWIATFSHRIESGLFAPVEAISVFWFGLLSSRALCATAVVRRIGEKSLMRVCVALAAAGCAGVVLSPNRTTLLPAVLLVSLGLGPIFPTLIAIVLHKVSGNKMFVVGGLASSLLPWMTGALSEHAHSLRVGLSVPLSAAGAMLILLPWLTRMVSIWCEPGPPSLRVELDHHHSEAVQVNDV